jgi:hypothetical protein
VISFKAIINIKFCVKLGKNACDSCAVLSKGYGGEPMKNSHAFEWHKQFKEVHKNVEDEEMIIQDLT